MVENVTELFRTRNIILSALLCFAVLAPYRASAQVWSWTRENVDTAGGHAMSLAVDDLGNVHISYGGEGGLKYGFRPVGKDSHWFTMVLGGGVIYSDIKVDRQGHPAICATYLGLPPRYWHFDGKTWSMQEVAPEDIQAAQVSCAVAVSPDGTPQITWYRTPNEDHSYAHIRYAVLKDGVWQERTLDWDPQTGKWHWMLIGPDGNPDISYDAFTKGIMKFAHWDGKNWNISVVDERGMHGNDYSLGMGNCLMFDPAGKAHISYYTDSEIRYASQTASGWKVETVDHITPTGTALDYRTSLLMDKDGHPHISYEDSGVLKHAYWDGKFWRVQIIAPSGANRSRFNSMAIDAQNDILYIAYQDAQDGLLRVAVGREDQPTETHLESNAKSDPKPATP